MRITRIYHPGKLNCGHTIQLKKEASNHIVRVLRSKVGTAVILFNGDGFDYNCKTLDNNSKKTSVLVEDKIQLKNESNLNITLVQGLSRQERMETSIQKSVELGANIIIPVLCQRSNTRLAKDKQIKKVEHWRKIAISACEQSGRSIVPEITDITSLENFVQDLTGEAIKIILNPDSEKSLKDIALNNQSNNQADAQKIVIFIGPEGGLNDEEITTLQDNNFENIRFGPRILRTETAGPAVISAIQMLWGDC